MSSVSGAENEENTDLRQLVKDIHQDLDELLIRVGRIEERQLELEKSAVEDNKKLKEYVKEEIDCIWNSMINYVDSQIEKVTPNRTRDRPRYNPERATEMAITAKADHVPRCFSCDDYGHIGKDCPHAGTNLRICFECKQLSDHIAIECPQRQEKDGEQRNYNNRERHGYRPYNKPYYSRGDYRGIKRRRENNFYDTN